MSGFRLQHGGHVDRNVPLSFRFDGQAMQGLRGDTLASALIANGVMLAGRSFKYHRPRGIFTAGSEEPNALVELGEGARREPNSKATMVELVEALEAKSQNRFPSLRFDLLAVNQMLARFLGAGFYYKTFMWPPAFWEAIYEPLIRRAAGLGSASHLPDPDTYGRANAFCDVLVIGAGATGLSAALAAARAGVRVIIADADFVLGGRLPGEAIAIDDAPAQQWIARVLAELANLPNVRLMTRTTIFGAYDGGVFGAIERTGANPREIYWKIVAKRSILAAGATERPPVFGDNDRPGIMLAGAVRTYIHRFAAAPGRRIGVYTCCDDAWRTALAAAAAGLEPPVIIDLREEVSPALVNAAQRAGATIHLGARITRVTGARAIASIDVSLAQGGSTRVSIDCLAVSAGWNPEAALAGHHGHKPSWDAQRMCFIAGQTPPGMRIAGAARGLLTTHDALRDGGAAGAQTALELGFDAASPAIPSCDDELQQTRAFWQVTNPRGKAFVDFQNDVTATDIAIAHSDGYRAAELLKRYTTLGMGTEQGRTANVQGLALMAALTGAAMETAGVTSFRPPFTPVAIGALAGSARGAQYRPTRRTPAHDFFAARGAHFMETGLWLRAQYFGGNADTAVEEARWVRSQAGFCDVSTLGKFEIFGPDAGVFLDRVYANSIADIPVGRARYALMLREDGFVMDDGTASRLSPTRFFVTSSTGAAARVLEHFEFCRQVLWPDLAVRIVNVTDHWAQFAVAGPHARYALMAALDPVENICNAKIPFMGVRDVRLANGAPARLFRISFSGELAFEIATPANNGMALAQMLASAARSYGLDALDILRIEKGHVADTEINGQTSAFDLGLTRLLSTKKDFIGRLMARRPALNASARLQLVGVRALDAAALLLSGAHLARLVAPASRDNDEGHVSSACVSPTLNAIGIALLKNGRARHGEIMLCVDPLRNYETLVRVENPVFIDPTGARTRG